MTRGRALLLVLALGILAVLAFDRLSDSWEFPAQRRILEQTLSTALGLDVRIGSLRLGLFPKPQYEARNVTVANLPGRPSPTLAEIGLLELEFDAWRLLQGSIEISGLDLVDAEFHVETGRDGRLELPPGLESDPGKDPSPSLDVQVESLQLENVRIFYRGTESEHVIGLRLQSAGLEVIDATGNLELAALGELDGNTFDIEGRFGSLSELLEPSRPYPVELQGRVLEAEVSVKGTLERPTDLRGIELEVSAYFPEPASFFPEEYQPLISVGPLTIEGRLSDPDGTLSLHSIRAATAEGRLVRAKLEGSIKDLRTLTGVDFTGELESANLRPLEPMAGRALPEASLVASATLSDAAGALGIEGEVRVADRKGHLSIELSGHHGDLRALDDVDVRARLHAHDLNLLESVLPWRVRLPRVGPLDVSARLRGRSGKVSLEDLSLELGNRDRIWAAVRGSVGDLVALEGIELIGEFSGSDVRLVNQLVDRELPDIGPIQGSVVLSDKDGSLGAERFRIRGGRAGILELDLQGELDDIEELDEIELTAQLTARDLTILGELFGAQLPPIGSVEFRGTVRGSAERFVSSGSVRLDKTHLNGEWVAAFGEAKRPSLRGRIRSPHVHLDDLGIYPAAEAPRGPRVEAARGAARSWWAGDEPLGFERLRAIDLDLDLRVDRVTGRGDLDVTAVLASVRLEDGDLRLALKESSYESGNLRVEIRIDAREPETEMEALLEADGIDLTVLMSQVEES
ncbi:MAG: AsmA family protein, partial [Myxococcota bacterium]